MDFSDISNLTNYAGSMATNTNSSVLSNKVNNARTDEELMDACKEFEVYLWEQVVKSMKETTNLFGEDSSNSQMVDYFMDTAITEMAEQLTEQTKGPGSLAQQMYEQMKRNNVISAETLMEQMQQSGETKNREMNDASTTESQVE